MTETTTETAEFGWYDPGDLLTDANARADLTLDGLESVKDLGVLVPVVALRTKDGHLRVRFGHRRVCAARHYGKQVPVFIAGDEGTAKADEAARLIEQWAENEHRAGFSDQEKAGIMGTLFDLKVSEAQIAKGLHVDRAEVKAAAVVHKSELATKALGRYDHLTLDQAATFAEFEGDKEALTALVATSKDRPEQFGHAAQELRDTAAERAQRAQIEAALTEQGITLVERASYSNRLSSFAGAGGKELTPEAHASCPGHAAALERVWVYPDEDELTDEEGRREWVAAYVCTDPKAHGHQFRGYTSNRLPGTGHKMTDEEKAQRRHIVDGNRKWRSATKERQRWLREFAARSRVPKGALRYVLDALAAGDGPLRRAMDNSHKIACGLLGLGDVPAEWDGMRRRLKVAEEMAKASDNRAQVIALTVVLAAHEASLGDHTWQQAESRDVARYGLPDGCIYLRALEGWGYALSDSERTVAWPPVAEIPTGGSDAGEDPPAAESAADDTTTGEDHG